MSVLSRHRTRSSLWRRVFDIGAAMVLMMSVGCAMHRVDSGESANPSVITETEIDSLHAVTALEVVSKLRPMFLVSRGQVELQPGSTPALPNVYVDEQFYGDATTLRTIAAAGLESIRFYSASEAQYKYGRGNAAGVIGITTKH